MRVTKTLYFITFFAWVSFFPRFDPWALRLLLLGLPLVVMLLDRTTSPRLVTWSDAPLGLFLLALTASLLAAGDKSAAWPIYTSLVTGLAASYYLGKGVALDPAVWKRVVWTVALCSAVVGFLGIIESVTGHNLFYEHTQTNVYYERFSRVHRPLVTQYHYAPLSSYLLAAWPFALVLTRAPSGWTRRFGWSALALALGCLAATLNRSALLGLVAMVVFYLLARGRCKWVGAATFFFAGLITMATFLPAPVNRVGWRGLAREDAGILSPYRVERIEMAVAMFKDNPDFGVGLGHFRILFPYYYPHNPDKVPNDIRVTDNMPAALLAETGTFGLGSFLLLMGWLLVRGLRAYRRSPPLQALLLLLAMSSLVGLLLSMGGYGLLYWNGPCLFFGLLCGLVAGWSLRAPPGESVDAAARFR